MAGVKLSAKAQEGFDFLESLLRECDHLLAATERYAGSKGPTQEQTFQLIVRSLNQIRQKAMMKNLGPIADAAGMLAVSAARGSPVQRARTLRDGLAGYKVNVERTIKALVAADAREKAEAEKLALARKKAQEAVDRARLAHEAEQEASKRAEQTRQANEAKQGEGA